MTVVGKYLSNLIFIRISQTLNHSAIRSLFLTQLSFFDKTPSGRILNRLTKDMALIDSIVFTVFEMLDTLLRCIFSLSIICVTTPWLLPIAVLSIVYLVRIRNICLHITRDTYRLLATM